MLFPLRIGPILVIVVIVVGAAIEIRRAFVLIGSSVLHGVSW